MPRIRAEIQPRIEFTIREQAGEQSREQVQVMQENNSVEYAGNGRMIESN